MNYQNFLKDLDEKLSKYFELHKKHICCTTGCSSCCEKGDYPLSQAELEYLMQGYAKLNDSVKIEVQKNIKNIQKGGACPFLIKKKCSIYPYRPIICRVHGLAYICHDNIVKVPYCANKSKNYSNVYKDGEIEINPIYENLDTQNILKGMNCGEIRNLTDWLERA